MRKIYRKPKEDTTKKFKANNQVTSRQLILIDAEGNNLGVVDLEEAKKIALEAELDLVEVNPLSSPPTARIINFGHFKYEKDKKSQKQKLKQKKVDIKCLRLSIRIGNHDFNFRLEQAKKFLARGDKLKIEVILRGRERQHNDLGKDVVLKFFNALKAYEELDVVIEEGLTNQGGKFSMLLFNKKK